MSERVNQSEHSTSNEKNERSGRVRDAFLREIANNLEGEEETPTVDAVVVLSGELTQRETDGQWRTGARYDTLERGLFARLRVIAAEKLDEASAVNDQVPFVVTGGRPPEWDDKKAPSRADVLEFELAKRGVTRQILKERDSSKITNQLGGLFEMANNQEWMNIAVVANEYLLPRLNAIVDKFSVILQNASGEERKKEKILEEHKKFRERGARFLFVGAEPILSAYNQRFIDYIEGMQKTDEFRRTSEMEARGTKDIRQGGYKTSV
jgi:hypothetical protein